MPSSDRHEIGITSSLGYLRKNAFRFLGASGSSILLAATIIGFFAKSGEYNSSSLKRFL